MAPSTVAVTDLRPTAQPVAARPVPHPAHHADTRPPSDVLARRYDLVIYTDVDPTGPAAGRWGCIRPAHCRSAVPLGPAPTKADVLDPGGGTYVAVCLPIGDEWTEVDAKQAGDLWQLLLRRFPARRGAGSALMTVAQELRCALWRTDALIIPSRLESSPIRTAASHADGTGV